MPKTSVQEEEEGQSPPHLFSFQLSNSPDSNWHGSDQAYFSARIKTPILPTPTLELYCCRSSKGILPTSAAKPNPLSGHLPRPSVWSLDYFQLEAPCLLTESVSGSPPPLRLYRKQA